jgi:hypothetical protein
VSVCIEVNPGIPWFQRFIFIIFIAKGRGKINLWNQGNPGTTSSQ